MTTRPMSLRRKRHSELVDGYGENELSSDPAAPRPRTTSSALRPGTSGPSLFSVDSRNLGAEGIAPTSNPGPSTKTVASRATTAENALKGKRAGWSAFDRYCSDQGDSASYYGRPEKGTPMLKALKEVTDLVVQTMANARKKPGSESQFAPHNSLNGDSISSRRKRDAGTTTYHGTSTDDDHGAKRRKIPATYATVSSRFAVVQEDISPDDPIFVDDNGSQTDKQLSVGSFSQANGKVRTNVPEFRQVERNVATPKGSNRPRNKTNSGAFKRKPGLMSKRSPLLLDDDILDSEPEAVDHSSPLSRAARNPSRKQLVLEISPRRPSTSEDHTVFDSIHNAKRVAKRQSDDTDQDELSYDPESHHAAKRRSVISAAKSTRGSASISTRGDLKPSVFPETVDTSLVDQGIYLRKAVAIPAGLFEVSLDSTENDPERAVLLKPGTISTLLLPINGLGEDLDMDWLKINLQKCSLINYDRMSPLVKIARSAEPQTGTGALLVLEFWNPKDAFRLVGWAKQAHKQLDVKVIEIDAEQLTKTFNSTWRTVEERRRKQEPQGGPSTTKSTERLQKLRQSNMLEKKTGKPKEAGGMLSQLESGSEKAHLRDRMNAVDERKDSQSIDLERDGFSELPPLATRRSSRISKAPLRSPTPARYESTWTEKHTDWAKDWRIPLSFHRTTVDKEDISRLDEGQFLNDSLIMFYLRYLHVTLEKKNPALAKRVYFHNSFFYEKLKPIRGRSVNYDGVKSWTAKIDLLAHDFIVVPVNEYSHWWVAIICNAPRLLSHQTEVVDIDVEAGSDTSGGVATDDRKRAEDTRERTPTHRAEMQSRATDELALDGQTRASPSHTSPKTATMMEDMSKMSISPQQKAQAAAIFDLSVDDEKTCVAHTVHDSDDDDLPVVSDIVRRGAMKPKKPTRKSVGPPPRKFDPKEPRIVTLDSLGNPHSVNVNFLKQYLLAEMKERKGIDRADPGPLGLTAKGIPQQENYCDCGVYLLGYIEAFIKDPDAFVGGILQREPPKWDVDAPELRNRIRDIILDLQKTHQEEEEGKNQARAERKKQKRERTTSRGPVEPEGDHPSGRVRDEPSSHQVTPASTPANSRAHSRRSTPHHHHHPSATLVAEEGPLDGLPRSPYFDIGSSAQKWAVSGGAQHQHMEAISVDDDSPTMVGASGAVYKIKTPTRIARAEADDDVNILPSVEGADDGDGRLR